MGAEIFCQVVGRPDQVSFIWSQGPASFEPYQLTGQGLVNFRNLAQQARQALSDVVREYLNGTDEDLRRASFALAKMGYKLHQQIFRPAAGPSQQIAKQVRAWLTEMVKHGAIDSLELVLDGMGPVPWNVVYEQEPVEKDFLSVESTHCWSAFWGIRYNLAGGRRVEPLRRLPWLSEPKLLLVVCPVMAEALPAEHREMLASFVSASGFKVISSKAELAIEMEDHRPDLMYWLCHATPSALVLNNEEISPGDLMDMFRGQGDEDRLGGLAFLNACQTAESSEEGSFMDALNEVGLSGVIATEHQTIDTFANPFGLEFLERFIKKGEPIGPLLQDLRSKRVPLGLLYSTYCPPHIRVMGPDVGTAEREIYFAQRLPGVALGGAHSGLTELKLGPEAATLPGEPYRLFAPFDRCDRALFVGREDDVRRFSLILDDSKARIIILHGESGVGKSSFLRAGVIPYLEDECIGYQFLSIQNQSDSEPSSRFIRATNDLVRQISHLLCEFCLQTYTYPTLGTASSDVDGSSHGRQVGKRREPNGPKEANLAEVIGRWRRSQPHGKRTRLSALYDFLRAEHGYAQSRKALGRLVRKLEDPCESGGADETGANGDDGDEVGSIGMAQINLAAIATEVLGCELRPEPVCAVLRADPSRFGKLLKEISRHLPHALILVIDQAEEIFTLAKDPKDAQNGQLAIELLRKAMAESGNFKIILSLRTEYYGRFVDRLRTGIRDVVGTREYLLTDFGARSLVESIRRPTSQEPIPGATEIPYEKYGFSFAEGLAERIAHEVLIHNAKSHDSVLPLVQVICSQLHEIVRNRTDKVIRPADLDAIGSVWGGMQRHIDLLVVGLVREFPPDLRPFKRLITRLYIRQSDGGLTTALIPLDDLASHWTGRQQFDKLLRSAVEMKLLKVNTLTIDEVADRPYVSLGHDALAKVASVWDEELLRGARLRRLAAVATGALALAGIMAVLALVARRERAEAVNAKNEAVGYLRGSMETLDKSFIKISEIDLIDIPGMVRIRERLLEEAHKGYHDLLRRFQEGRGRGTAFGPAGLQIRSGMGRAYGSLGDIERDMGDLDQSNDHLTHAIQELEELRKGTPDERKYQRDLARAYHGKGETLRLQGDFIGSEEYFNKAIALRETLPDGPDDIRSLAASLYARAALLAQFRSRYADAETDYKRAIDLMRGYMSEPLEGKLSEIAIGEHQLQLARYTDNLARLNQHRDRAEEALALNLEVQDKLDSLPTEMQGRPGVRWQRARCLNNISRIRYSMGTDKEAEEAIKSIDSARGQLQQLVEEFPEVPQYRRELAAVCQNLAEIELTEAEGSMEDKNFPNAHEWLNRSSAHSDSVIKMINALKTSTGGARDDGLNHAFSTFDMHLAEAWLHLLPDKHGSALQKLDMSAQLAKVSSDLKWLEESIEQPQSDDTNRAPQGGQPRITWHDVKIAACYRSLVSLLRYGMQTDRLPPKDQSSWEEMIKRADEACMRHKNQASGIEPRKK